MKRLEIYNLSSKSEDEPADEDKQLAEALLNAGITELKVLTMRYNNSWFRRKEMRTLLFSIF